MQMVHPKPCQESTGRITAPISGWDHPFIYQPGFEPRGSFGMSFWPALRLPFCFSCKALAQSPQELRASPSQSAAFSRHPLYLAASQQWVPKMGCPGKSKPTTKTCGSIPTPISDCALLAVSEKVVTCFQSCVEHVTVAQKKRYPKGTW